MSLFDYGMAHANVLVVLSANGCLFCKNNVLDANIGKHTDIPTVWNLIHVTFRISTRLSSLANTSITTLLRHPPLLVEALRPFLPDPWFLFPIPLPPPPTLRMARNAPIILERPGPVSYAADAPISNKPNIHKMARFSNSQGPELWEREYSRNFTNRGLPK
ncbi:hypothetical protein CDAR_582421 [Caerostris darwini]|uniref:Uncharacterized protein n=1 Tax=Caerostris darwini TaxID=1538125 RepID=A0AAV4RI03_9ARAC|nr:hypothetical protein CDAR_582421 [Caerostris darwini]